MNKTKKRETIQNLAKLFREDLAFQTILTNKYHIMVTFYLGEENKAAHEEKVANLKVTHPELTCIPLEKRNTLPAAIWKDEELDGLSDFYDKLEKVVNRCLVDQMYFNLVERANILVLLYEKITVLASIKNTDTIKLLLGYEDDIYNLYYFDSTAIGNGICTIAGDPKEDRSSWSQTKKDVYAMVDYLIRAMASFHCNDVDELVAKLKMLDNSNQLPNEMAALVRASYENLSAMMKSALMDRVKQHERFFLDITNLASMGLGDKIKCMLAQEDRLYDLPVTELDSFMNRLERSVGLL